MIGIHSGWRPGFEVLCRLLNGVFSHVKQLIVKVEREAFTPSLPVRWSLSLSLSGLSCKERVAWGWGHRLKTWPRALNQHNISSSMKPSERRTQPNVPLCAIAARALAPLGRRGASPLVTCSPRWGGKTVSVTLFRLHAKSDLSLKSDQTVCASVQIRFCVTQRPDSDTWPVESDWD